MEPRLSRSRRLLFSSVVLLIVLASIEVLLQVYYYAGAGDFLFRRVLPPIYESDATRCYRIKPHLDYTHRTNEFSTAIYTNSQGMRTDARRSEYSYEKDPDVFRILLLGPSFAFGWGSDYEDTYAARIERSLRVPGKRVELINLGTLGQAPDPQLCWLREEGYKYAPDLILQTSYGSGVPLMPAGCPETLDCPVVEDGRLYSSAPTFQKQLREWVKNFGLVFYGYYLYNALIASESPGNAEPGKELYAEAGRSVDPDDFAALIGSWLRFRDQVHGLLGDGARLAFVHIPLSYAVHREDAARWRHLTNPDPDAARAQTAAGVAVLREHGLAIIDTTPALVAAAGSERLYFWLDIHLTPAGNRVVAEEVVSALQGLGD